MPTSHSSVPESVSATTLSRICAERACRICLDVRENTASTNADVLKKLREGAPTPLAVFARQQSAGRGRTGRRWESLPGHIYASFGFAPKIPPHKMANFTLWMGVSVCALLERRYGVPVQVKWPNDLHVNGKKLAGMLTEVHLDAHCVQGVVFGIGLNVADNLASLPEPINQQATAIHVYNRQADINELAADLIETVVAAAERFFADRFQDDFEPLWARYDSLFNAPVSAVFNNEKISGTACGIDAGGSLRIRLSDGSVHAFSAGDVSRVRK